MRFTPPDEIPEATFDITPMVDVALLLIIFFMFSTHFAKTMQRPMDLPTQPGETERTVAQKVISVDMNPQGVLTLIDGRATTVPEVVSMMRQEILAAGGRQEAAVLLLRAHRDAASVHVNSLAAAMAQAGIRSWKLATTGTGPGGGS